MAQRQVVFQSIKQVWMCLLPKYSPPSPMLKQGSSLLLGFNSLKPKVPILERVTSFTGNTSSKYIDHALSEKNKGFIDLFTNNVHKQLYLPTLYVNKLKVYEDITSSKSIIDPVINNIKIIDAPVPGKPEKKEAVRMIIIRRRKMRKHKLKRFRKKYRFLLEKRAIKRELRKEQAFRTELLTQVEAADNFDAKAYVDNILHTIRYHPVPETVEERKARFNKIMKMNKYNTMFIRPKFDDDD